MQTKPFISGKFLNTVKPFKIMRKSSNPEKARRGLFRANINKETKVFRLHRKNCWGRTPGTYNVFKDFAETNGFVCTPSCPTRAKSPNRNLKPATMRGVLGNVRLRPPPPADVMRGRRLRLPSRLKRHRGSRRKSPPLRRYRYNISFREYKFRSLRF